MRLRHLLAGMAVLTGGLVAACRDVSARGGGSEVQTPQRVVSLDYCADQYVLKFVPRERILAVSPDATKAFSSMRAQASRLREVRPRLEDVLALQPDLVVRSYGGGANMTLALNRAGIDTVQIGWASTLSEVEDVVRDVSAQLGAEDAGRMLVEEMRARTERLEQTQPHRALYLTPGGVTTGPGSLVHEMLLAAGLENFETRTGWHELPLETLATTSPDLIAFARFDSHVTPWSAARHPVARRQMRDLPVIEMEGAWTSCGAWYLLDAVEVLAEGIEASDADQ